MESGYNPPTPVPTPSPVPTLTPTPTETFSETTDGGTPPLADTGFEVSYGFGLLAVLLVVGGMLLLLASIRR